MQRVESLFVKCTNMIQLYTLKTQSHMIRAYWKREIYFSMSPPRQTSWPSPGRHWTVPAPWHICAADPWCCASGRGRPPTSRSACSSESTAAPVCPQHREREEKHSTYRSRQCVCSCEDTVDQLPTQSSSDVCCYSGLHQTALQCYINSAAQMPFTLPVQWP